MSALRRVAFAIVLSSLVGVLYLFSPKVPIEQSLQNCVTKFPVTSTRSVDANCDAPIFLMLAARPDCLLAPTCKWQSRPLYVLSGALLRLPFMPSKPPAGIIEEFYPAYMAYLVFNFIVLVSTVYLFESLLAGVGSALVVHLLAVVLLTNDVVRLLVWSPHLQMLTILQPLVSIAIIRHMVVRPHVSRGRAVVYGVTAGFAPLLYGSGFLLLPALVVGALLRPRFGHHESLRTLLALAAAMSVAFAAPLGLWAAYLIARNGFFYSHEVGKFRQFVWLADAYRAQGLGRMIADVGKGGIVFAEKLARIGWLPLGLAFSAVMIALRDGAAARAVLHRSQTVVIAGVAALLLNVLFFVLMGYYTERLSLNVVPPLLLLTGVLLAGHAAALPPPRRRVLHAALCTVVLCWTVSQATKSKPWSFYASAVNAAEPYRPPIQQRRFMRASEVRYGDCPIAVLAQPEIHQ